MVLKLLLICAICTIFGNIHAISNVSSIFNENRNNFCDDCKLHAAHHKIEIAENFISAKKSVLNLRSTKMEINPTGNAAMKISSNLRVTKIRTSECPSLEDADSLSQAELISRLTASCRYDRSERPSMLLENGSFSAVEVFARTFIYVIQSLDSGTLLLKLHGLLQLRYVDPRLAFGKYAPNRQQPILGEEMLRKRIWVPHIFFSNEHDSSVLGTNEKDILTSISADGTVVISARIKATLYCWMDLRKFPFDEQYCSTQLESWMYNSNDVMLYWEHDDPTTFNPNLHFTEYNLVNAWCNETIVSVKESEMRHGAFSGNYSSLNFTVHLVRKSGYYIMDYFIPSIIIVAISWVSFWLQADQSSPRTTLSTATMLSFITLSLAQDNNLPKVGYIKISEIWFLSCIIFIFSSLIEFVFVNSIWRRKRNVELKKVNSKHILKTTMVPRSLSRTSSSNSLQVSAEISTDGEGDAAGSHQTFASMTPQEVALWIDKKARYLFPLAFLIFNIIFWILVYCL